MRFTPGYLNRTEQGAADLELDQKRCTICCHYRGTYEVVGTTIVLCAIDKKWPEPGEGRCRYFDDTPRKR